MDIRSKIRTARKEQKPFASFFYIGSRPSRNHRVTLTKSNGENWSLTTETVTGKIETRHRLPKDKAFRLFSDISSASLKDRGSTEIVHHGLSTEDKNFLGELDTMQGYGLRL